MRGIIVKPKRAVESLLKRLGLLSRFKSFWLYRRYKMKRIFEYLNIVAAKKGMSINVSGKSSCEIISVINKNKIVHVLARHYGYVEGVINNFDYYFDAVKPRQKGQYLIVDYSTPDEHVLTESGVTFYFTSFAEPLETTSIYLERAKIKEGDIVFDLGAYCGASSYSFARAVGKTGQVFAFEPDRENFLALRKNIERHSLSRVMPINKGIWSSTRRLQFQGEGNMGSGCLAVLGEDRNSNVSEIEVLSLDDICQEHGINRVDFIKMDIEGSEVEVLQSASKFLGKYRPRLVIEPHLINGKMATNDICSLLKQAAYSCEVIPQAGLPLPLIFAYPRCGKSVM